MPEEDGVTLDYRGYDCVPVRTLPVHEHGEDEPRGLRALIRAAA